jgi:GNAT superfamily N-acetyltransferase
MNKPSVTATNAGSLLALRPEAPADEPFLAHLYASTRQEELDATGWDDAARAGFLKMQFTAMQRGYHETFAGGEFAIIFQDDQPIGRVIVHRTATEIRIVDMALLPEHRNAGLGTVLVRQVMEEAARARLPLRLRVLKGGRSSHLCARLGFRDLQEDGAYDHWEWRSDG